MGVGDELLACGQALALRRRDPRPVAVRDRYGALRWHPLWDGVEGLARPEQVEAGIDCQFLVNGPDARPYIDYAETKRLAEADGLRGSMRRAARWRWKRFQPQPAEIALMAAELALAERIARPFVVIEPNVKMVAPNKAWGLARYQAVVDLLPGVRFVQMGGALRLRGVEHVETPSFRDACAVLDRAAACVVPEGGLHHAAAALGVPAVVIFGGFISPEVTGYPMHRNLFTGEGLGCGNRKPCVCCRAAMAKIAPEQVAHELSEVLRQHGG